MPIEPQIPKEQPGQEKPVEDRRSETQNLTAMVVRSFEEMGPRGRRRIRMGGIFFMTIGAVPPAIAGAFGRSLSGSYLTFEGLIFAAGLLLFWPDAFILFIKVVPGAVVKVMPNRIPSLFERRNQIAKPKDEE